MRKSSHVAVAVLMYVLLSAYLAVALYSVSRIREFSKRAYAPLRKAAETDSTHQAADLISDATSYAYSHSLDKGSTHLFRWSPSSSLRAWYVNMRDYAHYLMSIPDQMVNHEQLAKLESLPGSCPWLIAFYPHQRILVVLLVTLTCAMVALLVACARRYWCPPAAWMFLAGCAVGTTLLIVSWRW